MRILVVLGRIIGLTSIENLQSLKNLAEGNQGYNFLHTDNASWGLLSFNANYIEVFRDKYFKSAAIQALRSTKSLGMSYMRAVYEVHPKPYNIKPIALNHFGNIFRAVNNSSLVIAANENNRGRAAFALRAAKSLFVPNLNLASKKTSTKLHALISECKVEEEIKRERLLKCMEQFQIEYGVEFKPAKKINTLKEKDILEHTKILEGLLSWQTH